MTYTDTRLVYYREATMELQVDAAVEEGDENATIRVMLSRADEPTTVELPLNVDELDGLIAGLIKARTALAIELAMQERDAEQAAA